MATQQTPKDCSKPESESSRGGASLTFAPGIGPGIVIMTLSNGKQVQLIDTKGEDCGAA